MTQFPTMQDLAKPRRHAEWSALKKKHSAAISARRIAFDEKLGAALDKLSEHEAKLIKLETAGTLKVSDWEAHLALYTPMAGLAGAYRGKIKGLGGPAEAELGAALKNLDSDNKAWVAARGQLKTARVVVTKVTLAAAALYNDLQSLKTRTPAAIYEITNLVKQNKAVIPDTTTRPGKVAAELQTNGPSALFELKLVTDRLKPAISAAAAIEKTSGEVAGDAAYGKFKESAALLNSRGVGPLADPLGVLTDSRLTLEASIQINGIKSYGANILKAVADLDAAIRALP